MKTLSNIQTFADFDPIAWATRADDGPGTSPTDKPDGQTPTEEPVNTDSFGTGQNESSRAQSAYASAGLTGGTSSSRTSNPFDDGSAGMSRSQRSESSYKPGSKKPFKKTPIKDRIKTVTDTAKRQMWKGYKSELHPFFNTAHKIIHNRDR